MDLLLLNASAYEAKVAESLKRLKDGLIPNIFFIILGCPAVIFNTWVIVCIVKCKILHTKCYALLAANAFIDFMLGASYGSVGSVRLYRYFSGRGEVITMWECCWEASVITLSQMLSLSLSVVLVLDRLAATLVPHKYKNWSYKSFTCSLIIMVCLASLAQHCVHFSDSWKEKDKPLFTCGIEDTITHDNLVALITIQIITSITVVVLNVVLGVSVKRKQKLQNVNSQNKNRSQNQIEKDKIELKIFKTITLIVVLHILTHMGGRVILAIVSAATPDVHVQSLTSRYTRMLVVFNAAIHFFILVGTSSQFRSAVIKNKTAGTLILIVTGTGVSK